MADTFKFELVSPEKLLISANVRQVLVPGAEGDFTVLPNHAPVLSTLKPGLLDVIAEDGKESRIFVRGGIAEVDPLSLTVLAQQAINIDELDKDWLAQEIANTEEDVSDAQDEDSRTASQNMLDRLKIVQEVANAI